MATELTDINYIPEMIDELAKANGKTVEVGILGRNGSERGIAVYASANEYGALIRRKKAVIKIPERPFIRSTLDDDRTQDKAFTNIARLLLRGAKAKQLLDGLGSELVAAIRRKIASNVPPPNAPSTLRSKGSATTLIDQGAMKAAIAYVVV